MVCSRFRHHPAFLPFPNTCSGTVPDAAQKRLQEAIRESAAAGKRMFGSCGGNGQITQALGGVYEPLYSQNPLEFDPYWNRRTLYFAVCHGALRTGESGGACTAAAQAQGCVLSAQFPRAALIGGPSWLLLVFACWMLLSTLAPILLPPHAHSAVEFGATNITINPTARAAINASWAELLPDWFILNEMHDWHVGGGAPRRRAEGQGTAGGMIRGRQALRLKGRRPAHPA